MCHLKVQPMHIISSSIEIEKSGLHFTFGCATLKYKPMHIISSSIAIEKLWVTLHVWVYHLKVQPMHIISSSIRDLKIPRYRCTGTGSVPVHVKCSCA